MREELKLYGKFANANTCLAPPREYIYLEVCFGHEQFYPLKKTGTRLHQDNMLQDFYNYKTNPKIKCKQHNQQIRSNRNQRVERYRHYVGLVVFIRLCTGHNCCATHLKEVISLTLKNVKYVKN